MFFFWGARRNSVHKSHTSFVYHSTRFFNINAYFTYQGTGKVFTTVDYENHGFHVIFTHIEHLA